jgi:hypothetical protein
MNSDGICWAGKDCSLRFFPFPLIFGLPDNDRLIVRVLAEESWAQMEARSAVDAARVSEKWSGDIQGMVIFKTCHKFILPFLTPERIAIGTENEYPLNTYVKNFHIILSFIGQRSARFFKE